jgi:Flp pilus assembly protein TadG
MSCVTRDAVRLGVDTRGVSLLEMTIILPVLLTIGLGILEFGNALYNYHLITVGVRDGARYYAGLPESVDNDIAAQNIAATGVISGGTNRVSWWNASDVTVDYNEIAILNDDGSGNKLYRGGAYIPVVTVSTTIGYQSLGLLGYLGLGSINLTATHEERVYGNR